jgi:hypothetical protein
MLFISAYSPLFLILIVKDFDFKDSCWLKHPVAIYSVLIIIIISIILTFLTLAKIPRGSLPVKIKSAKNRSVDLINYTIPYILAFFGLDLSKPSDLISLTIFLLILLLLTVKSKLVFINPVLTLLGYGLYDLDYEFDGKIYSKIAISKLDLVEGKQAYIKNLTRHIFFVVEYVEDSKNGIKK